jgi:hypothetical protein
MKTLITKKKVFGYESDLRLIFESKEPNVWFVLKLVSILFVKYLAFI